ncbi:hypothetical protein RHGRI_030053 [Rhododendron griersonianum]|uniref:3,4-dihydroxy-2-butanone-4-phosphate synthase n=1 Tax=Rhododendron griersonianum TaxID=479676 RepID=A0AAV6IQ64_9ERIC|nr:hypothetical protein RHGRI_030053 [Rhododendron griersonianum]
MLDLISSPSNKLCLSFKVDGKAQSVQISGEGNFLSYSINKAVSGLDNDDKQANQPNGTEIQPDAVAFATLSAEMIPTSIGFYSVDDEFDLDRPTEGFSSIPEAIEDICQGKFVIVVDDENRENEGDLIMAASLVTPEAMAFIVKHGTGIVCVSMKGEDLERLQLPLMVSLKENDEKL